MRIALINGSPKGNNSASGILLEDLKRYLGENAEILNFGFHSVAIPKEVTVELAKADAWVFAYPLYVDGIPGHLLSCLVQLEEACFLSRRIPVYGIVNCGFYEGVQAEPALKLLQNWSLKAGLTWDGGGSLAVLPGVGAGHGPKAPVDKELAALAGIILKKEAQENHYVSIAFPRFLYKICAQAGWRQMIRANGGKSKDLGKIPE